MLFWFFRSFRIRFEFYFLSFLIFLNLEAKRKFRSDSTFSLWPREALNSKWFNVRKCTKSLQCDGIFVRTNLQKQNLWKLCLSASNPTKKGEWSQGLQAGAFLEHLVAVKGQWKAFASRMSFQKSDKNK